MWQVVELQDALQVSAA
jgi:hypothetical protein